MPRSIKTELLASYSTIVDLGGRAREIIAPYREIATGVSVQQSNRPDERVALLFEEEGYAIDLNWERIAFVGVDSRESYRDDMGPLRFFFQILGDLREDESFGEVDGFRLNTWDIFESTEYSDAESFQSEFIAGSTPNLSASVEDAAIHLESALATMTFGPFRPETDIQEHNLVIFNNQLSGRRAELMRTKGVLANVTTKSESPSATGHDDFLSLIDRRDSLMERLQNAL